MYKTVEEFFKAEHKDWLDKLKIKDGNFWENLAKNKYNEAWLIAWVKFFPNEKPFAAAILEAIRNKKLAAE